MLRCLIVYVGIDVCYHKTGYAVAEILTLRRSTRNNQSINQEKIVLHSKLIRLFIFKYSQIPEMKN